MKAKILLLSIFSAIFLAGCNEFNDEFEQTVVENMSGEWYCYVSEYDMWFTITTSNNSNSQAGKLLLNDFESFWSFIAEVDCNLGNLTFGAPEGVTNRYVQSNKLVPGSPIPYYDIQIKVSNGKITPGVVTLPSKSVVDKIEFTIGFEDDDPAFHEYTIKGYRKSGFEEDAEIMSAIQ